MQSNLSNTLLSLLLFLLTGCGVYSFTGAAISSDIKTISIGTFYNNAPLGPSNMSTLFTESIKDYFQQYTNLELVDNNGDMQIDGYISNYTITPVAATSSQGSDPLDLSSLSRITIVVSATFMNVKDATFDFDKNFSFFKDYDNEISLEANEEDFAQEIFDQIILDIFNNSVANW